MLSALGAEGALSQAELARATGLAASTVSALVHELLESGELRQERRRGTRGARVLRLATPPGVVVGLDHGRLHLAVAVAGLDGEILADERRRIAEGMSAADSLVELQDLVTGVLAGVGKTSADVHGAALGLPAPVDIRTGQLGSESILPRWAGLDPAALCTDILGFPVTVHNDSNLGALGEARRGAGRGASHFAYIWVSEGMGAGLIINDELYAGMGGIAGELGHTLQRAESGDLCRCGNRGCLETIVSTPAVIRLLQPLVGPIGDFGEVVRRIEDGDPLCRRVLAQTGRHIGVAVANLVNMFDPQRVIIGGELSTAGEVLLEPISHMVRQYAIPSAAARVEIVRSELGKRAEVIGAAMVALDNHRLQESNALPTDS